MKLSRRDFLKTAGVATGTLVVSDMSLVKRVWANTPIISNEAAINEAYQILYDDTGWAGKNWGVTFDNGTEMEVDILHLNPRGTTFFSVFEYAAPGDEEKVKEMPEDDPAYDVNIIPTTSKLEDIAKFAKGVGIPKPEDLKVSEGLESLILECSGVKIDYSEDPAGYYFSCVKPGEDLNNNLVKKTIAELIDKDRPSHEFTELEEVEHVLSAWAFGEGSEIWGPPARIYATPNRNPIAVDDKFAVLEDSTDNILKVLYNDTDPDGNPLTIESVTDPLHGTIVNKVNNVVYTPNPDYNGLDSFSYKVTDGKDGKSTANVEVDITSVNDYPVAVKDKFVVKQNSIDNILKVLANDADIDGDPLTIKSVTDPLHATAVNNVNNVAYTPNRGYCGPDSFSYKVTDSKGGTHEAKVTIDVTCLPSDGGDGCYTATRAFGENSPQVRSLRAFKHDVLLNAESLLYPLTSKAVDAYYFLGSRLVEYANKHPSPGRIIDTLLRPPIALAARLTDTIQKK